MKKIRVFEAFAGYGSQAIALKKLKNDFPDLELEFVGISEIDKYATQAYMAIHGDTPNYGDITAVDWNNVPDFDLLTWSSPCQDISNAGKGKGMVEDSGTRSSLLWEVKRPAKIKKPKYILFENVKNFIGSQNIREAQKLFDMLHSLGYTVFYKVLNAKDYGIPQNRERIFILAIYGDYAEYEFPEGFPLQIRLKDVLEEKVDEKYYLKPEQTKKIIENFVPEISGDNENSEIMVVGKVNSSQDGMIVHPDGIAKCLTSGHNNCPKIIEPVKPRRLFNIFGENRGTGFAGNVWDKEAIAPALTTSQGGYREPMIVESIPYDDYNSRIPEDKNVIGALTTQFGNPAPRHGWKVMELHYGNKRVQSLVESGKIKDDRTQFLDAYNQSVNDDVAGTIRTTIDSSNMHFIAEPISHDDYDSRIPKANVRDTGVCISYRIRKLTPRETFRLMGVADSDIDKIQAAGISNSQQYKLAGNSIVTSCLYYIFKNLLVGYEKTTLF